MEREANLLGARWAISDAFPTEELNKLCLVLLAGLRDPEVSF